MTGPYSATFKNGKKIINYKGNKVWPKIGDVAARKFSPDIAEERLEAIVKEKRFFHLHKIDDAIFKSAVDFFRLLGAEWCNLPLTTLMISSPGEVYAGKKLNYTTDTLPVELSWFGNKRKIFLSESSQFYLELRLLIDKVDKVFSIYNSFRKEPADFCHLSEFQHLEFEGKVGFNENISVFLGLLRHITGYLIRHNRKDLGFFLTPGEISSLTKTFDKKNIAVLTLREALQLLFDATGDKAYREFSLRHFGAWEEIKITELLGKHVLLTEYPVLQIPFYHNGKKVAPDGLRLAENADLILYGYRETVGSGTRITDKKVLARKAKEFNLPLADYGYYLKMRSFKNYKKTSGFGLGWQRYVQWLLKMPYIWEAAHIPRGHHLPRP
ncbi:MAG: asparagine--tRNA ligase [Patescibacteria group bacterium]|nr:asparagine--tRNA ligase [Patescibacteria group bacterium]MDE2015661.1 asparagine--tRNA ligase [Patescibacteria group bacterium]MDE2226718.1 asparagine--tRNA ligase [Patescibacteria group bacterium]